MYKDLRVKSGMTQSEAAKKMRLNVGFWCRVESGEVDLPPKHYRKASKLFKVPVVSLINLRIKKFATGLRNQVDKTIKLRCDIKLNGH